MTPTARDLIGLKAFAQDGIKLGKVREILEDCGSSSEYLVIDRVLEEDLFVPAFVAERTVQGVQIPFTFPYLDRAPTHEGEGPPSPDDCARLDEYYRPRAA